MAGARWRNVVIGGAAALGLLAAAPPEQTLHVGLRNRSGATLECHAIAGHWYGFDLGTIAAGRDMTVTVGIDPATGTISLPNSLHQPVPLQSIYCGVAGEAWRTRADLPLHRLATLAMIGAGDVRRMIVVCRMRGATLGCG